MLFAISMSMPSDKALTLKREANMDPFKPNLSLLVKLGSALVHADELVSPKGHAFDREALLTCLRDPEVVAWIDAMNQLAMLPVKR